MTFLDQKNTKNRFGTFDLLFPSILYRKTFCFCVKKQILLRHHRLALKSFMLVSFGKENKSCFPDQPHFFSCTKWFVWFWTSRLVLKDSVIVEMEAHFWKKCGFFYQMMPHSWPYFIPWELFYDSPWAHDRWKSKHHSWSHKNPEESSISWGKMHSRYFWF